MQTTWPRRADGKLCGLHAVTREVWIQRPVRGTNAEIHRDLRTQRPVCTTGAATTSARMHNERRPQASNHMNATNECSPLRLLRAPQRGWFSRLPLPGPPAGQRETIPSVEQCKCNNQSTCTNSGTPTSPKPCETDQPGEGTPAVAEPRPAAVRGGDSLPRVADHGVGRRSPSFSRPSHRGAGELDNESAWGPEPGRSRGATACQRRSPLAPPMGEGS